MDDIYNEFGELQLGLPFEPESTPEPPKEEEES
jgi:hypothetical protein